MRRPDVRAHAGFINAVRVGPVARGECRTIERPGDDVELMDSLPVKLSSWKQTGGAQRWLCVELPTRKLEVFIPLDFFEPQTQLASGIQRGVALVEK